MMQIPVSQSRSLDSKTHTRQRGCTAGVREIRDQGTRTTWKLEQSRDHVAQPQQSINQQREATEVSGQEGLIEGTRNHEDHKLGPRRHTVRKSQG